MPLGSKTVPSISVSGLVKKLKQVEAHEASAGVSDLNETILGQTFLGLIELWLLESGNITV